MNEIRETILALFFAGWIIMIALRVNTNTTLHLYYTQQNVTNQENLTVMTDILEYDFRKIGHGLSNPLKAIVVADSDRIVFSYDKNPYNRYDSIRVEYRLLPAIKQRDNNRLVRIENSRRRTFFPFKIERFNLKYYNKFGKKFPTPVVADSLASIREIEVTISLGSRGENTAQYGSAKYVTRFVPKNLLSHYE